MPRLGNDWIFRKFADQLFPFRNRQFKGSIVLKIRRVSVDVQRFDTGTIYLFRFIFLFAFRFGVLFFLTPG